MVLIYGKITIRDDEDEAKIIVDKVLPLSEVWENCSKKLCLTLKTDELEDKKIHDAGNIILKHRGNIPVYLNVITPDNGEYLMVSKNMRAKPNSELSEQLQHTLGENKIGIET